jgi:hypothetical protein
MFDLLYQYFIQQGAVSLPGIGSFVLNNTVVVTDFVNKQLHPPKQTISFNGLSDTPSRALFIYIAQQQGVSEWEAIKALNDFAFRLRSDLRSGKTVLWRRVGHLSADLSGEVRFEPQPQADVLPAVKAERVIRTDAPHNIRVGDTEKTNVEMAEWLDGEDASLPWWKTWWAAAIVLALTGAGAIAAHYMA